MALGPGLPTRMVCPSPFWRTASAVPMVPPPPDRFSTIADWPHAVCRCAAGNRPITSVVPPAAAGTMRRTFSVGRQSAAWPRRGKAAVADSAAAADSTRRRESSLVTFHSLLGFSFAGERRKCAGGRQADGLAQAPGLEHDPEQACPRATTRWVGTGFPSGQTRSVCPEIMLNKKIERDDDSKKSHPALGPRWRDFRDELTARAVPSAVHGRAWTKNSENNPMQSRVNPGSQHSCCAASGREKKNAPSSWPQPDLIPLQGCDCARRIRIERSASGAANLTVILTYRNRVSVAPREVVRCNSRLG